jgi:hypothetical protein
MKQASESFQAGNDTRPRTVEVRLAVHSIDITPVADLGDLTRFDKPTQLMSDLGLTPSEYSTGDRRRQGAITKTSSAHARCALLEGAWAYRYPAKVSRHLQLRLEKVPKAIQVIGGIQGVINKERQALLEEIIRGLPKSKGIEQEGLIYNGPDKNQAAIAPYVLSAS